MKSIMNKTTTYTLLLAVAFTITATYAQDQSVQTTMCQICNENDTSESQDCQTYITPLNKCYNAQTLFPDDPSWSNFDIYDTMSMKSMKRTFYKSRDGSCSNTNVMRVQDVVLDMRDMIWYYENGNFVQQEDDYFILPFDECVGPFGEPRPWGKFTLVSSQSDDEKMLRGLEGDSEVVVEK